MKLRFFELQRETKDLMNWEEHYSLDFGFYKTSYTGKYDFEKKKFMKSREIPGLNVNKSLKQFGVFKVKDVDLLASDNDLMAKNGLKYLPNRMIDPSILNLLKMQSGLQPARRT